MLKNKIVLIIAVTVIILGLSACKKSDIENKNTVKEKNEIGKIVETTDLNIKVVSVASGFSLSEDKDKQLLIVEMEVKNISKVESGAGASDFIVKADDGKTYSVYGLEAKNFGTAIKVGETIKGKGYYEIPENTKKVTIYYEPAGKKKAQWEVIVPDK